MSSISPILSQPSDCLCASLGLKLSPERLDLLFNALRSDQQDLTEPGLKIIDHLIYQHIAPPSTVSLHKFQTTDPFSAQIFSDMIEQSKDVRMKTPRPTLQGIERVQSLAQSRQGLFSPSQDTLRLIHRQEYPLLSLYGLSATTPVAIPRTPWLLADIDYHALPAIKPRSIRPGQICSFLPLPDGQEGLEQLTDLLMQRNVRTHIRRMHAITPSQYLKEILEPDLGCQVDLGALSQAVGISPEDLTTAFPQGYLVWTTKQGAAYLSQRLSAIGSTMTAFIQVKRRPYISFHHQDEQIFSCHRSALCAAAAPRTLELDMSSTVLCTTDDIPLSFLQKERYAVVQMCLPADRAITPDVISARLTQAYQTLASANGQMARCYLAVGICENERTPHAPLWSAALGIYAARKEFRIASHQLQIYHSEDLSCGTVICLIAPLVS